MTPKFEHMIKVDITHSTGNKFRVNLSNKEYEKMQTDPDYADQVADKYYSLFISGHITAIKADDSKVVRRAILPKPPDSEQSPKSEKSPQGEKRPFSEEDEEILIRLVSERPALYDFRLPMRERKKSIVRKLWLEVIEELGVLITPDAIAKKWKNIRDSYRRLQLNLKKKNSSGSSIEQKLRAEMLKRKHRHYKHLKFLDETLTYVRTLTKLDDDYESEDNPMYLSATPSISSPASITSINRDILSPKDEFFIEAVKNLGKTNREFSPTQNFCMRLADGLDKLPMRIKNQLELEFLTKLTAMENKYIHNESGAH